MSSVWNPNGLKRTLPPLRIVTLLGKKALTSDEYLFWNSVDAFAVRPIPTVFGLACAAAAGTSTIAAAARNAARLTGTRISLSFRCRSTAHPSGPRPNLTGPESRCNRPKVRVPGVLAFGEHWPLVAETPWRRPRGAERLALMRSP